MEQEAGHSNGSEFPRFVEGVSGDYIETSPRSYLGLLT